MCAVQKNKRAVEECAFVGFSLAKAVNVNRGKSRRCRNSYDEGHSSHLAAAHELDP